jgi:anhydro-N-acetylmuramic acid kinase
MRVLGLMSGTSADGVDVALASITGPAARRPSRAAPPAPPSATPPAKATAAPVAVNAPPRISVQLEHFVTLPYPAVIREAVLRIAEGAPTLPGDISELNFRLGEIFASSANAALRRFGVPRSQVDLIGSHGQTIYHAGRLSSLQIGEPAMIAELTGIPVVADFRPADIAAGGQGAPLVPFADYVLLRSAKMNRITLNLGGIANVTIIPAGAQPRDVRAFDTGPGNMVMDALMRHFTRGKQAFDAGAAFARRGQLLGGLLDQMMTHPYFARPFPKTAGREQFGHAFLEEILSWAGLQRARPHDVVFTATLLTATSIAQAIERMRLKRGASGWEVIVSGGGAHNPLLMEQLAALLRNFRIMPSSAVGIPEDAKEALAFAILAHEAWHRRPNSLPSATGARHAAILGKIVHACR